MDLNMRRFQITLIISILLLVLAACNKDEVFSAGDKPIITFDHEDGIYTVALGEQLTLVPNVENGVGAEFVWTFDDGTVVCRESVFTYTWNEPGEFYVLLTVTNSAGVDREEVRIDVIAPLPPVISLAIPSEGLSILKSTRYTFCPIFGNVDDEDLLFVEWFVDGVKETEGESFEFSRDVCGKYVVTIRATNRAGTSEKEIYVDVVDELPAKLNFIPLSFCYAANERNIFLGKSLALRVIGENTKDDYAWFVDGVAVDNVGSMFVFSPEKAGKYNVCVESQGIVASMVVNVVPESNARHGESVDATIIEYVPAPGQFIGETSSIGGMTSDIVTHADAVEWANDRFDAGKFVSLGAWGGYLIVKFDCSVFNSNGNYDFAVMSNAISSSSEPGIVWVMQDVNDNGLPDDEWYELRGSDFSTCGSQSIHATTYYRPGGDAMPVQWSDITGAIGTIDYLAGTHNQPSYYPAWVDADSYTLFGSQLSPRNQQNPVTGMWSNNPFDWGYVDNLGSDLLSGDVYGGAGVWTGFKIANAVLPDGTAVVLDYVDFVKIQTAIMTKCDNLGELSTEVFDVKRL